MPSIGNKAKLTTSEICQKCGRCCKEFNMNSDVDCGLRFLWMDERKVKAKDTPFKIPYQGGTETAIKFKYPCNKLEFRDNKYYCKVWDKKRPSFCNTYPDHVFYDCETWNREKIQKLLDYERENCPALKNIKVEDVIKMLEER